MLNKLRGGTEVEANSGFEVDSVAGLRRPAKRLPLISEEEITEGTSGLAIV